MRLHPRWPLVLLFPAEAGAYEAGMAVDVATASRGMFGPDPM